MSKLLSIVVPTKNRYTYLKYLIELVASFYTDDIELVINDNSDNNDEIIQYLQGENYSFVKYFYQKEPISMTENSDSAILNSSGKYVCFIGDDDGVTRHIQKCVEWMDVNGIEILKSQLTLYKWPSFQDPKLSSTVAVANYTSNYWFVDNSTVLKRIIEDGFDTLSYMPKVYNGIVRRDVLNRIYNIAGTFFPGPSPDMANAVALCLVSSKYVFLDFPIIIGGRCVHGGGNPNRFKGGYADIDKLPFLPKTSKDEWEPRLPKVWCVETVWPESGIKALRRVNGEKYLKNVNYEKCLALFIINRKYIWRLGYNLSHNRLLLVYYLIKTYSKIRLKWLRDLRMRKDGYYEGLKVHGGFEDIVKAEQFICENCPEFKIPKLKE